MSQRHTVISFSIINLRREIKFSAFLLFANNFVTRIKERIVPWLLKIIDNWSNDYSSWHARLAACPSNLLFLDAVLYPKPRHVSGCCNQVLKAGRCCWHSGVLFNWWRDLPPLSCSLSVFWKHSMMNRICKCMWMRGLQYFNRMYVCVC